MTRNMRGKVRGKTIELDEDLEMVDGQEVEVRVKVTGDVDGSSPGPGVRCAQGQLALRPR
jgi:hypothetical protein